MKRIKQSNLLKRGDVFILSKGTKVYHRTVDYSGAEVRIGEPTYRNEFLHEERVMDGKKWFTKGKMVKVKNFIPAPGEYCVTRTAFDGGGPDGYGGDYPNGHHIWARPVGDKDKTHEIHFYQTGCFTCIVENPERIAASGSAR